MSITSSVTVDWVTLNQTYFPRIEVEDSEHMRSPVPFYDYAVRYTESGIMAHKGNKKSPDMWLVTIPGDALAMYGWDNEGAVEFLSKRLEEGARISRLDMAVTIEDSTRSWTVAHVLSQVVSGSAKIAHAHIGHVKSIRNELTGAPETVYLGDMSKRGKKGLIRVYDKGLEMDIGAMKRTRVEIEDKRERAHSSVRRIVETKDIGAVVKTRFDLPDDDVWQSVVTASAAPLTRDTSGKCEPDTWAWLIEQVAPVLGRKIHKSEELSDENRNVFFDAVWKAYESERVKNHKPKPVDTKESNDISWV